MDKKSMHKSWLLSNYLERFIGSKQQVIVRRRQSILTEPTVDDDRDFMLSTGSSGEGFNMRGSDADFLNVLKDVYVLDPITNPIIPLDKSIVRIKRADCRPGFVVLELWRESRYLHNAILKACVPLGNSIVLSSDIFREFWNTDHVKDGWMYSTTSGPCKSVHSEENNLHEKFDIAFSLFCSSWPSEASEWATRPRIYGWPPQHLINKIVHEGCHIVPVGDKTSNDTFLQWRISFATAERKLVYSLSFLQFKVYGLLKYLLKQIESTIEAKTGEEDILCSYFLKTIIFYAVENSPSSLWQEKYTFVCFMHCLNLLIDWVNSAYCPNYFIPINNMFLRKVHGKNRRELLNILVDLRERKWGCLSVGTFFYPSIGERLVFMDKTDRYFLRREASECVSDMETYNYLFDSLFSNEVKDQRRCLHKLGVFLCQSQSEEDEAVCYCKIVSMLAVKAKTVFCERFGSTNNKQTYSAFRKCKRLLMPIANTCVSPGQLLLATFFYNAGNYNQTLDLCTKITSSFKNMTNIEAPLDELITYENRYCGKGHSLYHKCKEGCITVLEFGRQFLKFYPPQLQSDLYQVPVSVRVPPLPYAMFLSFLCYYDLGELRKCHLTLTCLLLVCLYDARQGGGRYWIVYNLLAICYQLIGYKEMAIWACRESLRIMPKKGNFSLERIRTLQGE